MSSTQIFNSRFVDGTRNSGTHKDYEKSRPTEKVYNDKDKNFVLTQSPTIEQTYDVNWDFYIRPLCEQILLLGALSDFVVKVIKSLHDVPRASINYFAIYHSHYKDKLVCNPTQTFFCATNCLYFLYG